MRIVLRALAEGAAPTPWVRSAEDAAKRRQEPGRAAGGAKVHGPIEVDHAIEHATVRIQWLTAGRVVQDPVAGDALFRTDSWRAAAGSAAARPGSPIVVDARTSRPFGNTQDVTVVAKAAASASPVWSPAVET